MGGVASSVRLFPGRLDAHGPDSAKAAEVSIIRENPVHAVRPAFFRFESALFHSRAISFVISTSAMGIAPPGTANWTSWGNRMGVTGMAGGSRVVRERATDATRVRFTASGAECTRTTRGTYPIVSTDICFSTYIFTLDRNTTRGGTA